MVQYGRSSRPSRKESLRSSFITGLFWEGQLENILLKNVWEKVPNWECLFVDREKGLFLSVYVDEIKRAGKTQNLDLLWKILLKDVVLGEPTSIRDHVYLGCTQRECKTTKKMWTISELCLNLGCQLEV